MIKGCVLMNRNSDMMCTITGVYYVRIFFSLGVCHREYKACAGGVDYRLGAVAIA